MTDTYLREIEAWHRARLALLQSDEGWLTLVDKLFFHEGAHTLGASPSCELVLPRGRAPELAGTITRRGQEVEFTAAPGVTVSCNGEPVTSRVLVSDEAGRADTLAVGAVSLSVMRRGDTTALRVRDPESPRRRAFRGVDRFPVDLSWRKVAKLVLEAPSRTFELDFTGDVTETFESPGVLELDVGSEAVRLHPVYSDASRTQILVLFTDSTSGDESYGLCRVLYAPLPEDGLVTLDFNQASLPGCAFTDYANCPLPPPENRLGVPVRAGETHPRWAAAV